MVQPNQNQSLLAEYPIAKVVVLQSWIRGCLARDRVKRIAKQTVKRRNIIQELLITESNYIQNLGILICSFRSKMLTAELITLDDANKVFSNVDDIRRLNQIFYSDLIELANPYTYYKPIFGPLCKHVSFFKIYFQYFRSYPAAIAKLKDLQTNSDTVQSFLWRSSRENVQSRMTIYDLLIKPVQRLPQYVLLLKGIKKATPEDHCDYQAISRLLTSFEEVNNSNNEKLNLLLNNYRVSQLERILGLDQDILLPSSQLLMEEAVTVLDDYGAPLDAWLYLLSTHILVSRRLRGEELLLQNVPLQAGCNITLTKGQFAFRFSFTVQSLDGESCTFLCQGETDCNDLLDCIQKQVALANKMHLQKLELLHLNNRISDSFLERVVQLEYLPEVTVMGTEERNEGLFKVTVYIVQVALKRVRRRLFLRFNEIFEVHQLAKQLFPQVVFKQGLTKDSWLVNHQPKVIEQRKILVQRSLWEILTKKQVVEEGQSILVKLGLPVDFYLLPSKLHKLQNFRASRSSRGGALRKSHRAGVHSIFNDLHYQNLRASYGSSVKSSKAEITLTMDDILSANQFRLKNFFRLPCRNPQSSMLPVTICIPDIAQQDDFRKIALQINIEDTIAGLVAQLARSVGFIHFKDLRLTLVREQFSRILDLQELVEKVVEEATRNNYSLVLRKVIFVSPKMEEAQLKADKSRLNLLASQLVLDVKSGQFDLSYRHLLSCAVLVAITKVTVGLEATKNLDRLAERMKNQLLHRFATLDSKSCEWQKDFISIYCRYTKRYDAIDQSGQTEQNEVEALLQGQENTGRGQVVMLGIVRLLRGYILYGKIPFMVQMDRNFRQLLKKEVASIENRNCWLLIGSESFSIYSIEQRQILVEYTYPQLVRFDAHSDCIFLHIAYTADPIKLKTMSSYEIGELIHYYSNYCILLAKVDCDEDFRDSILDKVREITHNARDSFDQYAFC